LTEQAMSTSDEMTQSRPGRWTDGPIPPHVSIGADSLIKGEFAFKRFGSRKEAGLVIGSGCTMDGVHFAVGQSGRLKIGNNCYFTNVVLLCELGITIGDFVMIGWNTTITDCDFHPIAPAERIADAIACSPLGNGQPRPQVDRRAIVIEDDVYVGPAVTILKGVTIGAGAWIEPGTVVTANVPQGARVGGNPARLLPAQARE
jgi:acetyltransferase-like isoleucine patch superfamily enzyme